jgi:N-acetylneuraminic acid mutarotase
MFQAEITEAQPLKDHTQFDWSQLPPIPDNHGFAGSFAGVSNGCLLVAGGANFPDGGAPWTGSKKTWTDKIFVLESANGKWKEAGKLPMPFGYGVSVVWNNKLICFGGSNADGHYSSVFCITYEHGKVEVSRLADLPHPLANSSGALLGNTVYIAGGTSKPDDVKAGSNFWALNLSLPTQKQHWDVLVTWPGAGRMLSVAGVKNGAFYLFSGAALVPAANGQAKRTYLQDAYCYSPNKGWSKLHIMPSATVAAPSPAYASINNTLQIFGGDDGQLADNASQLKEQHPGFSKDILSYDTTSDTWTVTGQIATDKKSDAAVNPNASLWAPVTTTAVMWNGKLVIPGGEVRPAVRTPRVLTASPKL